MCTAWWIIYAAVFKSRTGPPSTTIPSALTRMRSDALRRGHVTPKGLTQNEVGSTGSYIPELSAWLLLLYLMISRTWRNWLSKWYVRRLLRQTRAYRRCGKQVPISLFGILAPCKDHRTLVDLGMTFCLLIRYLLALCWGLARELLLEQLCCCHG